MWFIFKLLLAGLFGALLVFSGLSRPLAGILTFVFVLAMIAWEPFKKDNE